MIQIESCTKQQIQVDDLSEETQERASAQIRIEQHSNGSTQKLGKEVVVRSCKVLLPFVGLFIVLLNEVVVRSSWSCKVLLPLNSQHKLCGV